MGSYFSRQGQHWKGGQYDDIDLSWVVHIWLLNDSVTPPVYVHMPAVLDSAYEGELHIPFKDAQKLQLLEDQLAEKRSIIDAGHHETAVLTYKPVRVLVPMLDERGGRLAFFTSGWLRCTSVGHPQLSPQRHSPSAAAADQAVKAAGEEAVSMVADKSDAWVQLSPTKHPRHSTQALLGLKAMNELGLHLDREQRSFHTVKMRTIRRQSD